MDQDTITTEEQHFVGSKGLAHVRSGSCQMKTCPNLRCLETRTGKTECVKETWNYTELNTTLVDACMVGGLDRVKYILSTGRADINSIGNDNMTPVMHAAKEGHREVFDLLVQKGANLSLVDDGDRNILHLACIGGHVEIVKYVLTQNIVGINSREKDGMTPVMTAALYKRKGVFDLLVEEGADLLLVNEIGETILHVACEGGDVDMVMVILTSNIVKINRRDINGWTPVMIAASVGHRDVFDILVKEGSDLSQVNNDKETILHVACEGGNVEIVKTLLSRVIVDIDSRDVNGWTPVMCAAGERQQDVFDVLVEAGADLSQVSDGKETILHVACDAGNVEIVKNILSHANVDIDCRDIDGWTPVMQAVHAGHKDVFDFLVEKGADLLKVNGVKRNILHMAIGGENVGIIKYLLTHDIVDIDSRDASGMTPVMDTAVESRKDVFYLLVKWGADLSLLDYDKNNILHLACDGDVEIVKYLLTHSIVDINSRDGEDCTPAMIAAREGQEAIFFLLVDHEADLTITNDAGDNILNMACKGENVHIVKYVSTQHIVEGAYREDNPC